MAAAEGVVVFPKDTFAHPTTCIEAPAILNRVFLRMIIPACATVSAHRPYLPAGFPKSLGFCAIRQRRFFRLSVAMQGFIRILWVRQHPRNACKNRQNLPDFYRFPSIQRQIARRLWLYKSFFQQYFTFYSSLFQSPDALLDCNTRRYNRNRFPALRRRSGRCSDQIQVLSLQQETGAALRSVFAAA